MYGERFRWWDRGMDSELMLQKSSMWHPAVVVHYGSVACDPQDFESYEEALAARDRFLLIGYASGDRVMILHEGRHDACEHRDVEDSG